MAVEKLKTKATSNIKAIFAEKVTGVMYILSGWHLAVENWYPHFHIRNTRGQC